MTDREVMSWNDLGTGARALAQLVADDGYRPDLVLGIARGGLLVGGALGYALGVKNTFTMNVEFYTGIDERLELPMILPPVPDLVDFADFKVLVADDVADTGATLELVKSSAPGKWPRFAAPCSMRSPTRRSTASTSGDVRIAGSSSPGAQKTPSCRHFPAGCRSPPSRGIDSLLPPAIRRFLRRGAH